MGATKDGGLNTCSNTRPRKRTVEYTSPLLSPVHLLFDVLKTIDCTEV